MATEGRHRPWLSVPWQAALWLLTIQLAALALAHPTLVLGEVRFSPDPPLPGGEFTMSVRLQDPSLAPVEDAVVFLEWRQPAQTADGGPSTSQPIIASGELHELSPGSYHGSAVAPTAGSYQLTVRDRTFRQEEALATLTLVLGADALGSLPFVLPPTATGPRSLSTWLIWLIAVPLAAGALVTFLVLRGAPKPPAAAGE